MPIEVVSVSSDEVVYVDEGEVRVLADLEPSSVVDIEGELVTTLERPGSYLGSVATTNDVHFGETQCGKALGSDVGPVFSVDEGDEPYPTMMNRLAVAEISTYEPTAVVVKGDLSDQGLDADFQAFLDCYQTAFGDRLTYVRGNHDSYRGPSFADWPFPEIVVEGAIVALLATARPGWTTGTLSDDQLDQLDELGARADRPVLVMGHHPIWDSRFELRSDDVFGLRPDPTEALLAVFARRPRLATYAAGHTHRNRVVEVEGVPFVEVASLKEFPGAWCEYQIFDGGILQVVRRVLHPDALAWSDKTRGMYEGGFGEYAWGTLEERCRVLPTNRSATS